MQILTISVVKFFLINYVIVIIVSIVTLVILVIFLSYVC